MAIVKRVFVFLCVNLLIILTLNTLLNIFNIAPFLAKKGIDYNSLLIFCLIWGMGGAFISLMLSKPIAKMMMKIQIIKDSSNDIEKFLFDTVLKLSQKANLGAVPEIGIYNSDEVNAFATGATKNKSLIALSSGLISRMNKDEIEAIIGHEMSHISNGDMVTMTLIQGVANAFVMFLARALAYVISGMGKNKRSGGSFISFYLFTMLFEMVFMVLASIPICYFSRNREYRADFGGASLTDKNKMIAALQNLKNYQQNFQPSKSKALNTLKICAYKRKGLIRLLATHPDLDDRIAKLNEL